MCVLFFLVIPFLSRFILKSLTPPSDKFDKRSCFLAYKKPTSLTGSICALLTAPYGHCSLIVRNREFCFSKGILIERELTNLNGLTFKKINKICLAQARTLVGRKWSLINNCFHTFKKFK